MEAYGVPGNASPPVRQQTSEESATEGGETTSTPQYHHTETEGGTSLQGTPSTIDRDGRARKLQTTDLRALKGKGLLAFAKEMEIEVPMTSQSNNRWRSKSCTTMANFVSSYRAIN